MAPKRFPAVRIAFQRGTRRKLWVARWWEDVIQTDGMLGRLRRSEIIGTVAEFPTRRLAMQDVVSEARVNQQRQGTATVHSDIFCIRK